MSIQLKNETLTIGLTTLGGTLSSICDREGTEYLWYGNKEFWSGQAPVLFPICGSIRDDKAVIGEDKSTSMPRHGIVRKKEFTLSAHTDKEASFTIESGKESLVQFPYDFRLTTNYKLSGNEVIVTYEIENLSAEKMPFFVGGHPGFNCPLAEGESYEDYYLEFEKIENCTIPTPQTDTGLIDMEHRSLYLNGEKTISLKHELFHKDAIILDELKSRSVKLLSKKSKKGIRLDFKDFPYLILWSSNNDGPFIALEPWTGLSTCSDESDVFEEKRNVSFVCPGERKSFSFTIAVL